MAPKGRLTPGREPEPNKDEQLTYYKSRVEEFESERAALLESIDKCAIQASELHRQEWESRVRADEVRELQKALSDAHLFLYEERKRLLALQEENDALRLQEVEDRKRIQQLLALDGAPAAARMAHQQPPPGLDTLMLKIESLQAQLSEQKQLADERISALLEDRRIREQEEASHRSHMSQQVEALAQKLKKAEETLRGTTKDYILARRDMQAAEERAVAAEASLQQEQQRATDEVRELRRRAAAELSSAKAMADHKLEDVASNLRKQLKAREDEVINLTSVHTATKVQLERRVGELEVKCARLQDSNKQLELRRHLDMDGFTADVTQLRKALAAIDRKLHEMRLLDRLDDDERLDAILNTLRRRAPSPGGSHHPHPSQAQQERDQSDAASVARHSDVASAKGELAKELRGLRGKLGTLEGKLATKRKGLLSGGPSAPAPVHPTRAGRPGAGQPGGR